MASQVFHEHKACYLAIDKIATGSLNRLFKIIFNPSVIIEAGRKKERKQVKASKIKSLYPDYFLFTFVRNPYDRAVLPIDNKTIGPTTHLRPQTWYIDIPLSEFDFVGRYETLDADLQEIGRIFNLGKIDLTEEIHKTEGKQDYRTYYKETSEIAMIQEKYAEDIKLLQYSHLSCL